MRAVLFALLAAILALNVQAQNWPHKPVRFVVPFPPGGATDVAARSLSDRLTPALGQQFLVENRAGASGAIGTHEVARAVPDGYTILFAADPVTLHLVVKSVPLRGAARLPRGNAGDYAAARPSRSTRCR